MYNHTKYPITAAADDHLVNLFAILNEGGSDGKINNACMFCCQVIPRRKGDEGLYCSRQCAVAHTLHKLTDGAATKEDINDVVARTISFTSNNFKRDGGLPVDGAINLSAIKSFTRTPQEKDDDIIRSSELTMVDSETKTTYLDRDARSIPRSAGDPGMRVEHMVEVGGNIKGNKVVNQDNRECIVKTLDTLAISGTEELEKINRGGLPLKLKKVITKLKCRTRSKRNGENPSQSRQLDATIEPEPFHSVTSEYSGRQTEQLGLL